MPFSEHRIKYLLREKTGKTLSALAEDRGIRLEELSMCIRREAGRIYPEIRIWVAELIDYHATRCLVSTRSPPHYSNRDSQASKGSLPSRWGAARFIKGHFERKKSCKRMRF